MERELEEKTVIITGGAGHIGYAIAEAFAKRGVKTIILLDFNQDHGEKATKALNEKYGERKAVFIQCDVTKDLEDVSTKIIQDFGKVDVLVNNAGILDESEVKKTVAINLTALIEWSLKFLDHMRKDRGGRGGTIINISSIYCYTIDKYCPTYKATKSGVGAFTQALGHEENYQKTGVRIFAVCPGFTKTNLTDKFFSKCNEFEDGLPEHMNLTGVQTADVVGDAVAAAFKIADSASLWNIECGKPLRELFFISAVKL